MLHFKSVRTTFLTKSNLFFLLAGTVSGFFVYFTITDFDIFWHLAAGKKIIMEKALLFHDPFAYTITNKTWIDVHWLFQIVVFTLEHLGNLDILLSFKSIVFGISIFFLCKSSNVIINHLCIVALLSVVLIVYTSRFLVPLRPVIFSALFISLFFFFLENFVQKQRKIYLILLLPVQILWVNSQGLFMIGPAIFACYLCGEASNKYLSTKFPSVFGYQSFLSVKNRSTLLLFFFLITCCTLINPYVYHTFLFALQLLGNLTPSQKNIYSVNVPENVSLLSMLYTDYTYYVYLFIVMSLLLIFSSILSLRHIRFTFFFSSFIFMILAYMAQRNLILFVLVFIPHFLWNVNHLTLPQKLNFKWVTLSISILLSITLLHCIGKHYETIRSIPEPIAPFSFPVSSCKYLKSHSIPGNLFNADRHGGYLIWKLYPQKKVFIDTRLTLRSKAFFARYLSVLHNPKALFSELCQSDSITQVILPLANTNLYFKLAGYLYHESNWNLVYTDGSEALFIIDSLAGNNSIFLHNRNTVDSIVCELKKRYSGNQKLAQEAIFNLGNLLAETQNFENAEMVLSETQSEASELLLSRIKLLQGYTGDALAIIERVIDKNPGNVQAQTIRASIALKMHKPEIARKAVLTVFIRNPIKVIKMLREISKGRNA